MNQRADHSANRSIDEMVADCADVTRRLHDLSHRRDLRVTTLPEQRDLVSIPEGALTLVSGLDDYGD